MKNAIVDRVWVVSFDDMPIEVRAYYYLLDLLNRNPNKTWDEINQAIYRRMYDLRHGEESKLLKAKEDFLIVQEVYKQFNHAISKPKVSESLTKKVEFAGILSN